ncbi:MAG: hypothetical protein U9R75_08650 [Candidatus Thermoplasmatota archaeon]|nr:hypothetical protein [Candidatus Thermoplasmatota archaeon]
MKERFVELRFNIDVYDISEGKIEARRNSLDRIVLGLYRRARVEVKKDDEKENLSIDIKWGGLVSAFALTGAWFFAVTLAILRDLGARGVMLSVLIGFFGVSINMILFYVMRARFIMKVKRDLHDLELDLEEKKKAT